jgi:Transposase, Mutator family
MRVGAPKVGAVIRILYLPGRSTGDFNPALEQLLGEDAADLSATTIARLSRGGRSFTPGFRKRHLAFKGLLAEIIEEPTREDARSALEVYRAKYPRALAKFDRDWAQLTALSDCPAEHWRQLRTTNPIESALATVRLLGRAWSCSNGATSGRCSTAYQLLQTRGMRSARIECSDRL